MLEPGHTVEESEKDFKKRQEWEASHLSKYNIGDVLVFKEHQDLSFMINGKYSYRDNLKRQHRQWVYLITHNNQNYYIREIDDADKILYKK
jgi:hypothetical protein